MLAQTTCSQVRAHRGPSRNPYWRSDRSAHSTRIPHGRRSANATAPLEIRRSFCYFSAMTFASGRRLFAAALSSLLLAGFLLVPAVPADATPTSSGSGNCVLIDTDFDIDDMMAIPAVIGNRTVAAIVTSEGYTRPEKGAAALSRLVAEPGQRNIPIIVGAGKNRSDASIISKWGEFVLDYRGMMNRLNDFLSVALPPSPSVLPSYKKQVVAAVAGCRTVDILVIGTFTSFVHYSPLIRSKIGEVVIMGKPLRGDKSQRPGNFSFNCEYDMAACRYAFNKQLPGLNYAFVDVPRTHCDETPNTGPCAGTVYGPPRSTWSRVLPARVCRMP